MNTARPGDAILHQTPPRAVAGIRGQRHLRGPEDFPEIDDSWLSIEDVMEVMDRHQARFKGVTFHQVMALSQEERRAIVETFE